MVHDACAGSSAAAAIVLLATAGAARAAFVTFESGQVRPLALSPDGTRLFAVNTPDNRLEIFDVTAGGLDASRVGSGRPRAGRGRGAQRRRGLGGQPPVGQRERRRRRRARGRASCARCWSATSRATSCSPGPGGSARSSPRRIAGRTARSIRSSPRRASAAPTSGCSTRPHLGASLGGTPLTIVTLFATRRARSR